MTRALANPHADMTLADVRRFGGQFGLEIGTHSPGDGVRRIQFIAGKQSSKRIIYTALGIREAEVFLRGYMEGARHIERGGEIGAHPNPPRIIYRAGAFKVYWNAEDREYHVTNADPSDSFGYYTTDRQDACDTADYMAERHADENPGRRYDRAHPGYKGADIRFNDDFAYRGYLVKYNAIHETYYVSKGGHHIGSASTADDARKIIDEVAD